MMNKISPMAIKIALRQRGYTVAAFAKKNGLSRKNVYRVISLHCHEESETHPFGGQTYDILLALSRELGFPVHKIIDGVDLTIQVQERTTMGSPGHYW